VGCGLQQPEDAPDQVLAVEGARVVPADLSVAALERVHRHRLEFPALAREVEGLFSGGHPVSFIRGIAAWPTVTLDSA
jgi:hypothetical protein